MEVKQPSVYRFVMTNKWKMDPPEAEVCFSPQQQQALAAVRLVDNNNSTVKSSSSGGSSRRDEEEEEDDHGEQEDEDDEDEEEEGDEDGDMGPGKKEIGQYCFELLTEHCVQERQGEKMFRCDVCDGTYRHAFSLKRHFLRTHVNYIYLSTSDISNCSITLSQQEERAKSEFVKRCKACTGGGEPLPHRVGLYRCNTCSQRFDELEELKYHIAHHPNNQSTKRFSCSQCNMTFSHKQNLVRHLSVHSGEKPYSCKHCGKGFPTATNQRRHERIHEGLKPYVCTHCSSHFSQSGDLKKHIRKLHGEFFHPCAFCLKYFSTERDLKEHCLSHGKTLEMNYRALKKKVAPQNCVQTPVDTSQQQQQQQQQLTSQSRTVSLHLVCTWCNKRFPTRQTASRHKKQCEARPQSQEAEVATQEEQHSYPSDAAGCGESHFTPSKYFSSVSENIALNLEKHVDGKINHLYKQMSNKLSVNNKVGCENAPNGVSSSTDWRKYNFPPDFAGVAVNSVVVLEENGVYEFCDEVEDDTDVSNRSLREESNSDEALDLSASSGSVRPPITAVVRSELNVLEKSASSVMIYICHACSERFFSLNEINEHKINNHPNVYCTHLEIESTKGAPAEIFQYHCSPVGILQKCHVLPSVGTTNDQTLQLRCTKCNNQFAGIVELHQHILVCGSDVVRDEVKKRQQQHCWPQLFKRGIKRNLSAEVVESTPQKWKRSSTRREQPHQVVVMAVDERNVEEHECYQCGSRFRNVSAMERHQKLCPKGAIATVRRTAHRCSLCGRSFSYAASLKKHTMDSCCPPLLAKRKRQLIGAGKPLRKTRFRFGKSETNKRKVLAGKILKDKKITLTHQVSILNPKVLEEMSSAVLPPPAAEEETDTKVDDEDEAQVSKREVEPELLDDEDDDTPFPRLSDFQQTVEVDETYLAPSADLKSQEISLIEEVENEVPREIPTVMAPVAAETIVLMDEDKPDVESAISTELDIVELAKLEVKSEDSLIEEQDKEKLEENVQSVANSEAVDDVKELVNVKTENDAVLSREQQHTCPNCKRTFTYLANFKKHLNHLCPLRQVKKEDQSGLNNTESNNGEVSKDNTGEEVPKVKNNVQEGSNGGTSATTTTTTRSRSSPQTCTICRKTFSSYVVMLKHRLLHKLKTNSSSSSSQEQGEGNEVEEDEEVEEEAEVRTRSQVAAAAGGWLRGGRRRKRRGAARRLRVGKRVMPFRKSAVKLKVEPDQSELDDNDDDEDELDNGSSSNGSQNVVEDAAEDEAEPEDVEDGPETQDEEVATVKTTRSKTTSNAKETGMKKVQISEYRKTILRKVNESIS